MRWMEATTQASSSFASARSNAWACIGAGHINFIDRQPIGGKETPNHRWSEPGVAKPPGESHDRQAMKELRAGEALDHYRLDSLVARSGMATIYRGTDLRTGVPVAIK